MPSLSRSISGNSSSSNDEPETLRVAILGTGEVGKTSFVNRLTMKFIPESHYPTLKVTNWLFQFEPVNDLTRLILDEHKHERMLYYRQNDSKSNSYNIKKCIYQTPDLSNHLILSNRLFEKELSRFAKFQKKYLKNNSTVDKTILMKTENPYYSYNTTFTGLFDNHSLKTTPENIVGSNSSSLVQKTPLSSISSSSSMSSLNNLSLSREEYLKQRQLSNNYLDSEDEDSIPIYEASHNFSVTKENTLLKYKPILPKMYQPPYITNILIDIIDTPAFNLQSMIPFLEASLFRDNLGVPYLQQENNRTSFNDTIGTMLTFSGSSELNGKIDAYVLVYSCYPSINEPPTYFNSNEMYDFDSDDEVFSTDDIKRKSRKKKEKNKMFYNSDDSIQTEEHLLQDIITMKEMLCDAWKNYKTYIEQWEKGAEGDIYSLMYNMRKKWESTSKTKKTNAAIDEDMPPIIIVATHTVDELASPILLEEGKKLATEWGCSFIACDNYVDYQCEEALGVIVAESVYYKTSKAL